MAELAPYREGADVGHPWQGGAEGSGQRVPGGASRWNAGKGAAWEPLRAELVAEVSYDHMQGTRFRHTTHFKRWRPDKPAAACDYEQLDVAVPYELSQIFGAGD